MNRVWNTAPLLNGVPLSAGGARGRHLRGFGVSRGVVSGIASTR
jgi:hypothetical protein